MYFNVFLTYFEKSWKKFWLFNGVRGNSATISESREKILKVAELRVGPPPPAGEVDTFLVFQKYRRALV